MPVEESGNMLILIAACACEGNARISPDVLATADRSGPTYLKEKGSIPRISCCTDDFAGHLAHNANLSIKAILASASYADLAGQPGHAQDAVDIPQTAREFAPRWVQMADDGDHYRLAFDKPGTWSQKYNLVWDRVLGLNLFRAEVARKEMVLQDAE